MPLQLKSKKMFLRPRPFKINLKIVILYEENELFESVHYKVSFVAFVFVCNLDI